ncbi:MAG: preprotein translocase subunit SecE [Elusimicrobiota bacterium]|nr:preprotein translocase subunit SecE [Elusimicrobiota bacterium]
MNKITSFLKEVYAELTKVTWLNRQDVLRSTIAVSFVVIIVAIYVSLVDFGLSIFVKSILGGR